MKKEFPMYMREIDNLRRTFVSHVIQDKFIEMYQDAGNNKELKEILIKHAFEIFPR